jgi:methionine-R-sulfoxide reductase
MKLNPTLIAAILFLGLLITGGAEEPKNPKQEPSASPSSPEATSKPKTDKPMDRDLSKLSKDELAKELDQEAYYVCIMGGTERPFENKYWNNHAAGIYVDVISGKALFASTHKFDSGSGWPSFFNPIDKDEIESVEDRSHGMKRIEVRAKTSGAHLGHVFDDGPKPTGLRYCINSAALRFVPVADLKKEGLEKYQPLFEEAPADAKK